MAFLFIDDFGPESDEYNTNYIYFDEKKEGEWKKALQVWQARRHARQNKMHYEFVCDGC
ncbi:MAG: hypothetical protein ONB12_11135 [candidate division KSB1 bacterium]|nr:hypothetical protein [candidate division KSB1 bacterium]